MNGPTFAPAPVALTAPTPRPPARPPARPAPAAKPADDSAAALRVLTYLRLHWLTILFCGGLIGCGLAYAAWTLLPPKYESYAVLHATSVPTSIGGPGGDTGGRSEFSVFMKTQAQMLKFHFVLESALSDPKFKIASLPTLADQKNPIKFLDEKLIVSYAEGAETIRVGMEGDRPEDIGKIVNAVVEAYKREVIDVQAREKTSIRQKVDAAKVDLEKMMNLRAGGNPKYLDKAIPPTVIQAVAAVPSAVPADPNAPFPLAMGGGAGGMAAEHEAVKRAKYTVATAKFLQLDDQIKKFPLVVQEKKKRVEDLNRQIAALNDPPLTPEAVEAANKDPEVQAARFYAVQADRDAHHLAATVNNPNSGQVIRAKQKAEDHQAAWVQLRDKKARQGIAGGSRAKREHLEDQVREITMYLDTMGDREKVARAELEEARKDVIEMPQEMKKDGEKRSLVDPLGTEMGTLDDAYRAITSQQIKLGWEPPERMTVRQPASAPMQKDAKKQVLGTVVAGLLGFALVGLGAVAVETSAKKVCSLGELRSNQPTPVVGVIPWQPGAAADPARRADVAEAIDKLRSYVSQTYLARGATTVAVTSPVGDEGKAFTAFGLASSLARAGYKTLLADFDLRTPALHLLAGVDNGPGVCELLRGETDPRAAVLGLPDGLWFLPAGAWSDDARRAAVGGRLEALLAKLKEPFDCVVLHGHALLTVAETVEIVRRSEVVLLCSLYRDTRLPLLKRAADRVAAMEVPYSGVVYLGATPQEALC